MTNSSFILSSSMAHVDLDNADSLISGFSVQIEFRPKEQKRFKVSILKGNTEALNATLQEIDYETAWTLNEAIELQEKYLGRIRLTKKLPKKYAEMNDDYMWFSLHN